MTYIDKVVTITGITAPTGALKVDDLPIISAAFAAAIAKTSDASPLADVWRRTVINSEETLFQDLYNELMKEMKFRQLICSSLEFYSSTGTRVRSARYEGARFRLSRSQYTKITFKELYVAGSGTFDIVIFDLTSGVELKRITAQTVTSETYVPIDFSVNIDKLENNLFACITASAIDLKQMDGNRGFMSDNSGGYNADVSSGCINIAQAISPGNFTQSACFVHFSVDIETDINQFFVKNARIFATAAKYLCGYHILKDSLSTDNFNLWTNTNYVQRENNSLGNYQMYMKYLRETVQKVMMILAPTPQLETKSPEEKPGIQRMDALAGSIYDIYDQNPFLFYPE